MASSSSTSLPSSSRDAGGPTSIKAGERQYRSEMMFIGERCHLSVCNREDFLPFRCADCHHQFCSDHYKTADHRCTQASKTFLVPLCPLCHEPPKNWKRDEDPNIAMNMHLSPHRRSGKIECSAVDEQGIVRDDAKGKQRRVKRDNECSERKCKKLMIVPIMCPSCHQRFCPSHRAPVQHTCSPLKVKPGSNASKKIGATTSLFNAVSLSAPKSRDITTTATEAKTEMPDNLKSDPLQAISAVHKGFKTDKRARSEHESALKALKARHAKGLLSSAEEVRLAQEIALEQERKSAGTECVVI